MASVTLRPNGHRWVTFKAPNGKRQTIRLGAASEQQANNFKEKVELLLVCKRLVEPVNASLTQFLVELPDGIHATLSKCGVVSPRGARTVGALTAWFTSTYEKHCEEKRRKASTLVNVKRSTDAMNRFFGKDRNLRSFKPHVDIATDTETEGERFRAWLMRAGAADGGPLAPTTVSSMCRRCRALFDKALKLGWMLHNPLADEKYWVSTNPDRDEYVPAIPFELVMDETDKETRLFYSLIRYAGLRGVSEIAPLEWLWLNLEHHTLFVKSPKTARHEGHESRFVPLSDHLFKMLVQGFHEAPVGAVYIFGESQITNTAWDNRLEAACRRAKVLMWGKLKINMRASCEYDWLRKHPIDDVASWMGHSPETMLRHYNRVAKQLSAQTAGAALQPQIINPGALQNAKRA